MPNKQRILNILGLAKRANKLIAGGDSVLRALKHENVRIVFLANDAAANTINRFEQKCYFYGILVNKDFTGAELSKAIGKTVCKVAAVIDYGFYNAIYRQLNGGIK